MSQLREDVQKQVDQTRFLNRVLMGALISVVFSVSVLLILTFRAEERADAEACAAWKAKVAVFTEETQWMARSIYEDERPTGCSP